MKPPYPVVCMALDWTRKSSRMSLSLHELMENAGALREELELTDDAELKVYHMRNLSREVRGRFISDMGFYRVSTKPKNICVARGTEMAWLEILETRNFLEKGFRFDFYLK